MTGILALLFTGALFVWFMRLERDGRPVVVVGFLLGLLIFEAAYYQSQNEIPVGLFHPEYRTFSFRLVDIVIPAALLARLLQRTNTRPTDTNVLLWLLFLAWLATAGVAGAYDENPLKVVGFHGKAIIYLGTLVLAAGVPLQEYVAERRVERFLAWSAGLALLLIATDMAHIDLTADLPLLPLQNLGVLGTDIATVFSGLGALALALGLFAEARRGRLLAMSVVLLATPAFADQRAAFLALAAALATVVGGMLLSRRRLRVTPTEAGLALTAVVALLLASALPGIASDRTVTLPLQGRLTTTFTSYEEVLTTRDRLNQWSAARPLIAERPILGWGLGKEYAYYDPGHFVFKQIDLTHNILGDIVLRTGFAGLALFLLAFGSTWASLLRGWWSDRPDRTAAFGLGVGAIVAGLAGKGMAESIFEKYRLAAVLGIGIGAMISAGLPARSRARAPRGARSPVPAPGGSAASSAPGLAAGRSSP